MYMLYWLFMNNQLIEDVQPYTMLHTLYTVHRRPIPEFQILSQQETESLGPRHRAVMERR